MQAYFAGHVPKSSFLWSVNEIYFSVSSKNSASRLLSTCFYTLINVYCRQLFLPFFYLCLIFACSAAFCDFYVILFCFECSLLPSSFLPSSPSLAYRKTGSHSLKMQPINFQTEAAEAIERQTREELGIPDETFTNSLGVAAPVNKRRSSIIEYKHELQKKINLGNDDCYKVERALADVEVNNDYASFASAVIEINQNIRLMAQDLNRRLDRMDGRLDRMEVGLEKITPLMLYVRVSENFRRRDSGLTQIPVPFIVGEGPQNTDLPIIESVKDIESLSKPQVKRYLTGYAVDHDANAVRKELKAILRDTLGYSTAADLRFSFT